VATFLACCAATFSYAFHVLHSNAERIAAVNEYIGNGAVRDRNHLAKWDVKRLFPRL
jgi:hypothetical protein